MPPQTTNVQPTFQIPVTVTDTSHSGLYIELGATGLSYVVMDHQKNISGAVLYSFSPELDQSELLEAIQTVLKQEKSLSNRFEKTHIIWSFPECLLVPHELMDDAHAGEMLDLVYGDAENATLKTDFIYQLNMHALYRIPEQIEKLMRSHFSSATQVHQYALLPVCSNKVPDELLLIFYNNRFTAMLHVAGKLQMIRSFNFQQPLDALYHLLNMSTQFNLDVNTIQLRLCGMVDAKSNLFETISKYFLHIEMVQWPADITCKTATDQFPPHFFSQVFIQALCV